MGIDLVEIAGLAESIAHFGDAFLHRVFTPAELAECDGALPRLAARFAAKEAAMKVLRPSRQDALPWRSIEVAGVELLLHAEASSLAAREQVSSLALSLTHERHYAAAVVVAQRGEAT